MQFLEVIETIRSEAAEVGKLFGGSGERGVRSIKKSPEYAGKLAEAAKFVAEVYEGKRPIAQFREALETTDFPLLFGDVIDRVLLGNYRETEVSYTNYLHTASVADFRDVKRFAIDGSEAVLPVVAEGAAYTAGTLTEAQYTYAVAKHGRTLAFSWEAMTNDDLGAFRDVVARMGVAARRSEEKFATDLFVNAGGPDPVFFSVANNNIVAGNPALSVAGLQAAISTMLAQVDTEGEPIYVGGMHLVVPPQLKVVAMNILNALEIRALTGGGGTAAQGLVAVNWMKSELTLSVNSYLPIVDTTSGDTAWYVFADPNEGRPAAEVGKLRGHEEPEVFIKTPNATRAGSGTEDAMLGDFATDSIEYKVRHTFGGTLEEPKSAVASTG